MGVFLILIPRCQARVREEKKPVRVIANNLANGNPITNCVGTTISHTNML